ncbi:MAG: adenylate/guanylate cyclase domain-containing protein [Chloroflexota bacterium]
MPTPDGNMPDARQKEIDQLRTAITAQESLRGTIPDEVIEATVAALQVRLSELLEQAAEPKRKQVTVLFADVVGFTAMSESMDAEVVARTVNELWMLVDDVITTHGGRIDKHIGDAVMALWGTGIAQEDDVEQAVRAALELRRAVAAFCRTHSLPLAMRVGLNTGPVLLGTIGTAGEFSAMGDTVNLASRLEAAAPIDRVLISHDTYRHIRGIFDVEAQPDLRVKGKAEPIRTYILVQPKPRAFRLFTRGIEGIETRMVGRDNELRQLQTAYLEMLITAQTHVVTILGEAGVGKSRLLEEFEDWLELRPEEISTTRDGRPWRCSGHGSACSVTSLRCGLTFWRAIARKQQ